MKLTKNRVTLLLTAFITAALIFLASQIIPTAPLPKLFSPADAEDALYLALVGPMSGAAQSRGEDMVRGAETYLDVVNRAGGIDGKQLKLFIYDDQNDVELARARAQEIVAEGTALAVLGHLFSAPSRAAGEIYQEAGIPAISGSATAENVTEDNDWFFRVVFDNQSQATFLANYVKRIMGHARVSIIYAQNDFGTSVARDFDGAFRGLGGEVKYIWRLDPTAADVDAQIREIAADLLRKRTDDPGMIFLATHGIEAVKLVVAIRRKGMEYQFIGADSLSDQAWIQAEFNRYPEEQAQPGYFSDGIHATSHIIFDVAGQEAQRFRYQFTRRYEQEPSWTAATYYDAALVAVEALRAAEIAGDREQIAADRALIRDHLARFNDIDTAIAGITGALYFDKQGNAVKPVAIGVFDHQQFISALTQLQPVPDLKRVTDLAEEMAAGRILIVGGQYMYKTDVVYTGIDFNEISELDMKDESYLMDFYLWFRHRGNFDDTNIEFDNAVAPFKLGPPIAEEITPDLTYRVYRVKAKFKGDFEFHDYPFDYQELVMRFRHTNLTRENLIYVQDMVGMRHTTDEVVLDKLNRNEVLKGLGDWFVEGAHFFQDIKRSESTLGDPHFFDTASDIEYSRFNAVIEIKRDGIKFGIKNLFPLFIITLVSYIAFFIPPRLLAVSNGILRSALLAVAFFHLKLAGDLPGIGYTIALDYAFYIFYTLVLFAIIVTLVMTRMDDEGNKQGANRAALIGKIVYPAVVIGSIFVFSYRYTLFGIPALLSGGAPSSPEAEVAQPGGETAPTTGETVLRLGSWRSDDEEQMNRILDVFHAQHPDIVVKFDPITAPQYNAVLRTQLELGAAPDLFYLRSFSFAEQLIDKGYLEPLDDLPSLRASFTPETLAPWAMDGTPYGVPLVAVSHGVYYNVDLFAALGLEVPTTWEELLTTAQVIQDAGYTPFANAAGAKWTIAEIVFMNLAPNFIGGLEGRQMYLRGERCFNDEHVVAAFQAIADIAPYFPANHQTITYDDSLELFLQGQAAMLMDGSWQIPQIEARHPDFVWSIFATPAPAGQPEYVTFHTDVGIGLNAASPHKEEARIFLDWLTTPEMAELLVNELPGFFPMHTEKPEPRSEHARTFLALNEGRATDVRWAWPVLMESIPDGYSLMQDGAVAVLNGEMTAPEAADALQDGLAQWFEPAQRCQQTDELFELAP